MNYTQDPKTDKNSGLKMMLKELSEADLNPSQAQFIKGLNKWFRKTGQLSEKQQNCLKSIHSQVSKSNIVIN